VTQFKNLKNPKKMKKTALSLFVAVLFLAACNSSASNVEETVEETVEEVVEEVVEEEVEVLEEEVEVLEEEAAE
jgi:hypothetical protein